MAEKTELILRYEENPSAYFDPVELEDIFHYYAEEGMIEQLAPIIEHAVELHPEDVATQSMQAEYALNMGSAEDCLRLLEPIFNEDNPFFCILKSGALAKLGRIAEATELAEKAQRANDPLILYDLGLGFMNAEEMTLAVDYFKRCHKAMPGDLRNLLGLLYCLHQVGSAEELLHYAELALEIDSFCQEAWMAKSSALADMEKWEEAIEAFDYALAIDPTQSDAYNLKAGCLVQLDRMEEALATAEEGLPHAEGQQKAQLYMLIARLQDVLEHRQEAIESAVHALECGATQNDVLFPALAFLSNAQGGDKALPFMEELYRKGNRSTELMLMLGEAYALSGDFARGLDCYRQLAEVAPNTYHKTLLAGMEMSAGHYIKAYRILKSILEEELHLQSAVLMAVCACEQRWYTAMEDALIIAFSLNKEDTMKLLKHLSEPAYRIAKEKHIEEHAEELRLNKLARLLQKNMEKE